MVKNVLLPEVCLSLEICPNIGANVFWLKVRTRGPQPSICVPIFSQFTKNALANHKVYISLTKIRVYGSYHQKIRGSPHWYTQLILVYSVLCQHRDYNVDLYDML